VTTATVDDRKRIRIPELKPGQVVSIESSPDGSIRLVPVAPVKPKRVMGKLVKRDGALVFEAEGVKIDPDAIGQAVADEQEGLPW